MCLEKEMFVNKKPIFKIIPQNSVLFYILNLTDNNELIWFFNNYNTFYSHNNLEDNKEAYIDFYFYYDSACKNTELLIAPFIKTYITSREKVLSLYNNYTEFAIKEINLGCYIYITLHVRNSNLYSIDVDYHNAFIYGYSLIKNVFYVIDFFDSKFEMKEMPFEDYEKCMDLSSCEEEKYFNIHGIWSISKKKILDEGTIINLSIKKVINDLRCYKNGYSDNRILVGDKALDQLIKYTKKMQHTYINTKGYYFIKQYCEILLMKIKYFNNWFDVEIQTKDLINCYEKIKKCIFLLNYTNEKILRDDENIMGKRCDLNKLINEFKKDFEYTIIEISNKMEEYNVKTIRI